MNTNIAFLFMTKQLIEGLEEAIKKGFEVYAIEISSVSQPVIHIRPHQYCLDAISISNADYYTVGSEFDLFHYRIGSLFLAGCRFHWLEMGNTEIEKANNKLREIKNVIRH